MTDNDWSRLRVGSLIALYDYDKYDRRVLYNIGVISDDDPSMSKRWGIFWAQRRFGVPLRIASRDWLDSFFMEILVL